MYTDIFSHLIPFLCSSQRVRRARCHGGRLKQTKPVNDPKLNIFSAIISVQLWGEILCKMPSICGVRNYSQVYRDWKTAL